VKTLTNNYTAVCISHRKLN